MTSEKKRKPLIDSNALPEPVFESAVRSLYRDKVTMATGSVSMVVAALVLYARQWDYFQLLFAIAFALIGAIRYIDVLQFEQFSTRAMSRTDSNRWERRYAVLAAIHVGSLGFWCFLGFAFSSDEFVHQMSVILMLSNLIGITGRNFASEKVVFGQTFTACLTIIIGTLLFGGIYDLILAILLLPLFYSIWSMSRNLRNILFSETLAAAESRTLADRFDVALDNIAHGMAMIDREGRILVYNARFAMLCGLQLDRPLAGLTLMEAERAEPVEADDDPDATPQTLVGIVGRMLRAGRPATLRHVLQDGRVIEAIFNPMRDDGGVIVLEDITERMAAEEEIRNLASFDPLTHLPNRRFFMTEVNRLLGGPEGLGYCTLLFVDLDNFKDVNDTLGHGIGDKLLCSIALRMRSRMPEKAMICRFGGDEFVIVMPGRHPRLECKEFADSLIEEIGKPMVIDGHHLLVGASIGIAQSPENGTDYSHLLKVADMALYEAKAHGRGRTCFYSDQLGDQIRDRRILESDLRRAVERGQLHLHFQPLIDIASNRITTCEALLRWNHPERGAIPPSIFIPIAEEIGLMAQLGAFVIEEAARNCRSWPEHVSVAVNVSALQFQQSDVCAVVGHTLVTTGLEPHRLEIEVTESAMLADVEQTKSVLARLKESGVRISLDDFGTGFSSLSYLHVLPLDKVKIDRSFIANIEADVRSMVLLTGVSHLAAELGLSVVVEGVETEEQRRLLLSRVHVDQMQGYLFGRAMPALDISRVLSTEAEPAMPPLAAAGA